MTDCVVHLMNFLVYHMYILSVHPVYPFIPCIASYRTGKLSGFFSKGPILAFEFVPAYFVADLPGSYPQQSGCLCLDPSGLVEGLEDFGLLNDFDC